MNANEVNQPEGRSNPARNDEFLLRINHEIRTAVNATLGMTELLFDSQLTREQSNRVDAIRMSSDQLLKQSSIILDLARAESGSLQLQNYRFPLKETLRQTIELLAILASPCGVTLRTRIADNLPETALGDPARLTEVLTTVVRTAIDRAGGGEVSIDIESDIDATGVRGTESVGIELSVTGASSNTASNIIYGSPLNPEDGDAHPEGEYGALELAKCLARMMGGHLRIEGWPEAEPPLRFTVNLKVACPIDSVPGQSETGPAIQTRTRRLKILVADDALHNHLLVRAFVKNEPWDIDTAANGRIAVEKAVAGSYNLILMDLDMPEMDGYTATRQIRISQCANQLAAVPIVALTAHSEAEAVVRSFEAGCNAHVTKPFTKASLIQTIQNYAAG